MTRYSLTEFSLKQKRLKELLEKYSLDAILLQLSSSFAWATCGAAAHVNTASSFGSAILLVTAKGIYLITDNIEATRLKQEEKLIYQGWEFQTVPWYQKQEAIARLVGNGKLGSDAPYANAMNLADDISHLRSRLTSEEGIRFRVLGRLTAEAMNNTAHAIQPGWTEHQIAARLAQETLSRGASPIVNLIATDERVFAFRHPLPTYKTLDRYAMLVLCARRWGLVCSITRLVYFGHLPEELRRKAEAVALVDATLIASTKPGIALNQIFERATAAYTEVGFADEWQLHHQGGLAGYEPRECIATPTSNEIVFAGQAFAWNPSITGVKSEDTIQVGEKNNEILTTIPDWPIIEIEINRKSYSRPAILEIE